MRHYIVFLVAIHGHIYGLGSALTQLCLSEESESSSWHGLDQIDETSWHWDHLEDNLLKARKCRNANGASQFPVDQGGRIRVDCGQCKIFELNVDVFFKKRHDGNLYSGLTHELLHSRPQCLWKQNCYLQYSPAVMLWNQLHRIRHVTSFPPTSLELHYSCLDTDEIPVHNVIKDVEEVTSDYGLIRTHAHCDGPGKSYPRDGYGGSHFLTVRPNFEAKQSSFVLLQLEELHICQGDNFTINDNIQVEPCRISWKSGETYKLQGESFTVGFEIFAGLGESRSSCLGCVQLCFQWFEADNANVLARFKKTLKKCQRQKRRNEKLRRNLQHKSSKSGNKNSGVDTFDLMQELSSHAVFGVIRSHSSFPWNYPRKPASTLPDPEVAVGVPYTSYTHRLHSPGGIIHPRVRISAEAFALATKDFLEISSDEKVTKLDSFSPGTYFDAPGRQVNVTLRTFQSGMPTDSGFVLCYQWFSQLVDVSKVPSRPCSQHLLPSEGCQRNPVPKKCRQKKKGKKRRKKNKRKGRKITEKKESLMTEKD